jgi:hypothetical protein
VTRPGVIELGEIPSEPPEPAPEPARRSRTTALAVAGMLVAVLGGAAQPLAVEVPAVVQARPGDATFTTAARYFVVRTVGTGRRTEPERRIDEYRLPDAALVSSTLIRPGGAITRLHAAGDVLLVVHRVDNLGNQATVGVATGSGRVLWRRDARLLGTSPSGRLAVMIDQSAVGPLRWYGVDPATGGVRWARAVPPTGVTEAVMGVGDDIHHIVTVTLAGHAEVYDPESGAVTAAVDVPVQPGWAAGGLTVWSAGDLLLVGGATGTAAYTLGTLAPRWQNAIDLSRYYALPGCGDVVCLTGRSGGLVVLDAATGTEWWRVERQADVVRVGPYLLARAFDDDAPLTVLDAVTGAVRGDFGRWRPVGPQLPGGTVIAVLEQRDNREIWYAQLDPAAGTVRVLGVARPAGGICETRADRLICRRPDASVGLWRLPAA